MLVAIIHYSPTRIFGNISSLWSWWGFRSCKTPPPNKDFWKYLFRVCWSWWRFQSGKTMACQLYPKITGCWLLIDNADGPSQWMSPNSLPIGNRCTISAAYDNTTRKLDCRIHSKCRAYYASFGQMGMERVPFKHFCLKKKKATGSGWDIRRQGWHKIRKGKMCVCVCVVNQTDPFGFFLSTLAIN